MHQDAGLPLVLAVAAAHTHEAAGALSAAEAPPRHFGPLALQSCFHLPDSAGLQALSSPLSAGSREFNNGKQYNQECQD